MMMIANSGPRVIQKVIFHLEAFVAKFMRIYERYAFCFSLEDKDKFFLGRFTNIKQQLLDGHGLLNLGMNEKRVMNLCVLYIMAYRVVYLSI